MCTSKKKHLRNINVLIETFLKYKFQLIIIIKCFTNPLIILYLFYFIAGRYLLYYSFLLWITCPQLLVLFIFFPSKLFIYFFIHLKKINKQIAMVIYLMFYSLYYLIITLFMFFFQFVLKNFYIIHKHVAL